MLYYLAHLLEPHFSALNVLTYNTVRAAGAALTGFLFCLIIGPKVIAWLRVLKIGQFIKKDHVADLHELHKGKAGTPTMGGVLIVLATLLSLLLWSDLMNRLLLAATIVLCMLAAVGFLDDFIKLRRKHNDGLSARAKLIGQTITGLLLGSYLFFNPVTVGAAYVNTTDIINWPGFIEELSAPQHPATTRIVGLLPHETRELLQRRPETSAPIEDFQKRLLEGVNVALNERDFYDEEVWSEASLNGEFARLRAAGMESMDERELVRHNRILLEAAMPQFVAHSVRNLHTKIAVPGLKWVFIPLGFLYIFFVTFIIIATSNAVNVTDGLDGLAAGASVVSIMALTAIAYIVSRADWSAYLFLTYIPEASELTVFGGALLGTGLGFLWYNAHPAEVFMGDTGSLALGGAIASLAILTKQELLLPIVAGLFVVEAASVSIQIAVFKATGKRVFRMAPIHHHFELKGWSETKITLRFWIIALLFALTGLATLKLR